FAPMFPEQHRDISYGLRQTVTANYLVASNAALKFFIPTNGSLGSSWVNMGFNDSAWTSGTNGVGYQAPFAGFAVKVIRANVAVTTLAEAESVISTPSKWGAAYSNNTPLINFV